MNMLNDNDGKLKVLKALETDLKKVPLTLQVSKDLLSEASQSIFTSRSNLSRKILTIYS